MVIDGAKEDYSGFVRSKWQPQCRHCANTANCEVFNNRELFNDVILSNYAHCSDRKSTAKFWEPRVEDLPAVERFVEKHPGELYAEELQEALENIERLKRS